MPRSSVSQDAFDFAHSERERLIAALKASRAGTWRWNIADDIVEWDDALCDGLRNRARTGAENVERIHRTDPSRRSRHGLAQRQHVHRDRRRCRLPVQGDRRRHGPVDLRPQRRRQTSGWHARLHAGRVSRRDGAAARPGGAGRGTETADAAAQRTQSPGEESSRDDRRSASAEGCTAGGPAGEGRFRAGDRPGVDHRPSPRAALPRRGRHAGRRAVVSGRDLRQPSAIDAVGHENCARTKARFRVPACRPGGPGRPHRQRTRDERHQVRLPAERPGPYRRALSRRRRDCRSDHQRQWPRTGPLRFASGRRIAAGARSRNADRRHVPAWSPGGA